ncbi:MAG TPA: stage 0 sporulation family protein [Bacillota bacterium]|jgi:cell fate regulator YaaT (PSP1 superfamily)|nr:stage 0 sporulation family protein [Bacillota bacterium]HOA35970.1 stage 0 sporulation family protein [Bacillota bacterium]HOJ84210.1 stage 0 sporulation family protein [Bacillota bacterium]HOL14636.1 stage 0 sporulation family protein [Bacillota bacterium]HPZ10734.1 stage 0 sporulation family protein [Bacillota bacterium]
MPRVIGVRFRRAGKIYHFDPGGLKIERGTNVIVETARGLEMGQVVIGEKELPEDELVMPLKKVLRLAGEADLRQVEENKKKEAEALPKCQAQIERHGLNMKLVGAEYTFDRSKIIFYFTSDERVDFRELVKDLAAIFRTRIELRQIGVRDEAKLKGGIGPCGRSFCCDSFLEEFAPVSIRMAKGQNLSLNPTKISGVCGRLMCCLRFEMSAYEEAREEMPQPGEEVVTPDGEGQVMRSDPVRKVVQVKLRESDCTREFPAEEVDRL